MQFLLMCKNKTCSTKTNKKFFHIFEIFLKNVLDKKRVPHYNRKSAVEKQLLRQGVLAQLGEHLPYKQRVTGSSPVGPTSKSFEISYLAG